uniref:Uncharacterized protein n=1 Tax=Molossus molossus TaxID=27622 RepID=A0A7J8JVH2_MOLMO|nr:hypothetical protein HJG59_007814 [Molossus molossus]
MWSVVAFLSRKAMRMPWITGILWGLNDDDLCALQSPRPSSCSAAQVCKWVGVFSIQSLKTLQGIQFSVSQIIPVQSNLDWDMFPGKEVHILFLSHINLRWLLLNSLEIRHLLGGPLYLAWLMSPC